MMKRRVFGLAVLALGTVLAGCGSSGNVAKTGTTSGTLADMLIRPAPGTFAISRSTVFTLAWPEGTTPPPTFEVRLYRYQDARSNDFPRTNEIQDTKLTREGDRFVWDLERSNNLLLDDGGIYYLQVKTSSEEVFASYIVAVGRSVNPEKDTVNPEKTSVAAPTASANTSIGTVHRVTVR
jgi:hypothetical protein